MNERSMFPPSLNLSSVTSLERRSTAEGMIGSVSPRPTEKKRLASSAFDEALAEEATDGPKSRGRSPSQPILSLLEHEEQIRRYASRKSPSASSERPWDGNEISVMGSFVSGMLVSAMTTEEREGYVRQNSIRTISSVATCDQGEHLAIGDRSGRVFVMKRDQQTFGYFIGKQCYTPVIDPLNSVEVTPLVSSVAFLPQYGPTTYLIASNEKVPKLYKIMAVRDTPQPPKAVSLIGTKMVGPLTSPQRTSTTAMKQVHHYAMDHEYNIHSVCPVSDGSQFYSVDDLAVRLWCVDHPLSSIEVFSLKARQLQDGEPRELIRKGFLFDNEPGLFFMTTSCGAVRVVDARESLRWVDRDPLIFHCPPRLVEDGPFAELTNNISSCALSPCGRYLCARDFMSATLWDIRKSSADVVGRWEVHSHLRPHLDALYQSELLLERFDVKFISSSHIATGSFSNTLCLIDSQADVVKKYQLPNLTEGRISRVQQVEELTATPHFGEGSRVTALTNVIPQSSSNRYEIGVACGECLLHVAL